jgi:hypothetical protein
MGCDLDPCPHCGVVGMCDCHTRDAEPSEEK